MAAIKPQNGSLIILVVIKRNITPIIVVHKINLNQSLSIISSFLKLYPSLLLSHLSLNVLNIGGFTCGAPDAQNGVLNLTNLTWLEYHFPSLWRNTVKVE